MKPQGEGYDAGQAHTQHVAQPWHKYVSRLELKSRT